MIRDDQCWHSHGSWEYHVCKNCPDAPPAEHYSIGPKRYRVYRGRGDKRICGKCLDLIGARKCKKVDRAPLAR